MARLFGTDGIRGIAGRELTPELAFALGRAAVLVLAEHGSASPTFLIGRDTRASGEMLEEAMAGGIRAEGGDVLLAGVQTTPAVAFLTVDLGAASGVVISASHNPPEYNGIKLFDGRGYKLPDRLENEIEGRLPTIGRAGDGGGRESLVEDATERYLAHLTAVAETGLDGLHVVIDCANGAASGVSPEAFRRLAAKVEVVAESPDGANINVGAGAMHPEVVAREVVRAGAGAGVAHDGDADRAMFADGDGNVVDGDQVLAACAIALKDRGRLPGNLVVTTVMANLGFRRAMREAGIEVVTTKVGDRYVLEEMLRTGAAIGGEQSGHVIFRDHATTGDGILTAIKLLSFAAARDVSLAEFVSVMRKYPQVLENVLVSDRAGLDEAAEVWAAVRSAEAQLGGSGRVLVRASGTEPLVRVMVEAETEEAAREHAGRIAEAVRAGLG